MKIKKMIPPVVLVCTLLALASQAFAKSAASDFAPTASDFDDLDAYVRNQIDRLNIPGASLAVVEDGEIVHLKNFGEMPDTPVPFMIGSLTKSFTALAVMQLVEAGQIQLDAPVQAYLPWFKVADAEASAQITVRHLLNQTSGFSSNSGWMFLSDFDDSPGAAERQARALSSHELLAPVGTEYHYSNANFNVLGLVVEAASGQRYADYIQEHIFKPLNMQYSYTSLTEARQNGLVVGHQMWFWKPFPVPDLLAPAGSLPSGQLIATAEDMGHYMIAMLNGGQYEGAQVLSAAGVAEIQRGVAESVEMGIEVGKYAMGWFDTDTNYGKVIWHTGMVPDFSSMMVLLPEQNKGLVLLFNADHFMLSPILSETSMGLSAVLAGVDPEPSQFDVMLPWMMRSLLLVPVLQILGVALTGRALRRWKKDPDSRPIGGNKWGRQIVLPALPNLLVAASLLPLMTPMSGFWRLFMPDYRLVALISGSFAAIWTFLRTGLVLRALKK